MRFTSFERDGEDGLAVEVDGRLHGLVAGDAGSPGSLDDVVRSGDFEGARAALATGPALDPGTLRHALPFRRAAKVLCVGLNYADHAAESKMQTPDFPTVFVRFNSNLVPHGQPLVRPSASEQLDYEGELVAVIGKAGRGIAAADALDHVAGYGVFNDGSVRDYQLRTTQWTIGKNFDGTGALGSTFVTADELPPGAAGLRIRTELNGETMQDASTADLIFTVADLVSMLSTGMTLEPGDLIVTGTPSGVGMARDPKVFMQPGDVCRVEIEGVGVLENDVVAQR